MNSFKSKIESAISAGKITGAVTVASDATKSFTHTSSYGLRSLDSASSAPLKTDAILAIASCTKLLTSISALQCVERGQFTLDEDVSRLVPELKLEHLDILQGFDAEEKPKLVKATKNITLRMLLTHTSGLAYDISTPDLIRWRATRGEFATLDKGTLISRCKTPLMFEPGTSWAYSTGLDWAGLMISRANNMTLEEYMHEYICAPLGITDLTFHIDQNPALLSRLVDMTVRVGGMTPFGTAANTAGALVYTADTFWSQEQIDDAGGVGVYMSIPSYEKVLHSITISDEKLLSKAMNDRMFEGQLTEPQLANLNYTLQIPEMRYIMTPSIPADTKLDHGLGGMILLEDLEGRRRKGAMYWGGLPNLSWWADREAGVSGIYGSQLIPTGDKQTAEMFEEFEKAVYAEVEA
ncbi:putative beta-lactamase family protein [Botrytis fragariae]|uniref:Putative beta-lactamase family protein n=1 Tax=Botrytis fragariae TaxID=1964551 RepID=A0A8H6AK43_9HELO|nr:putative beta-lactamase family protein [Botrytis fragariae]KAF5868899.1 putative beta-lactamase family protein [Botrytis fragariae]